MTMRPSRPPVRDIATDLAPARYFGRMRAKVSCKWQWTSRSLITVCRSHIQGVKYFSFFIAALEENDHFELTGSTDTPSKIVLSCRTVPQENISATPCISRRRKLGRTSRSDFASDEK